MCVLLCSGSFNFTQIILSQSFCIFAIMLMPIFFMLFISVLAETNRAPFDLPEAEGELVAGYNVEYSSVCFTLFFVAEYLNLLFMGVFVVILFLGGCFFLI